MDDKVSFSEYICPLMSKWDGIKHCSYKCRFYDNESRECLINMFMGAYLAKENKRKRGFRR